MIKKIYYFTKIILILWKNFLITKGTEEIPVIELGTIMGGTQTYSLAYFDNGEHSQHKHANADAELFFISGSGSAIIGENRELVEFNKGTVIRIPRGTWHGFIIKKPSLFLAIQSSAITDLKTGTSDVIFRNDQ